MREDPLHYPRVANGNSDAALLSQSKDCDLAVWKETEAIPNILASDTSLIYELASPPEHIAK